ncbi:hypothetical protein AGABI1DRAFT_135082 [Agaricus bisporus var. burnettii JB137-S8]|uniref:Uncharacterized protein n=1 Tax=Agaricus bisporus var. burnettii (strain JB137-S8 / ATCC MYA-4627 / FGSC 10392) TaxID=597362 RepID=K5VG53_AGABU|nr:uncharacterized protein AGABI1DRAFT_135082 [Agaricus bisporus var. burnettii JB137-S8]EKM73314.1 hypothetical protein AGABI1DRAFT_135082 [Agaricus bisporus var. burnettii JB137-S8]
MPDESFCDETGWGGILLSTPVAACRRKRTFGAAGVSVWFPRWLPSKSVGASASRVLSGRPSGATGASRALVGRFARGTF